MISKIMSMSKRDNPNKSLKKKKLIWFSVRKWTITRMACSISSHIVQYLLHLELPLGLCVIKPGFFTFFKKFNVFVNLSLDHGHGHFLVIYLLMVPYNIKTPQRKHFFVFLLLIIFFLTPLV